MKRNFSHLNTKLNIEYDPNYDLLKRSTSKVFWKDTLIATFLLHVQHMLMTGYNRIRYIRNYQNPTI